MSADAKQDAEDARRLREFPAFAKFSDDDLEAARRTSASLLDVGATAADSPADPVGRVLHPAQRGGRGVRRLGPSRRGGAG